MFAEVDSYFASMRAAVSDAGVADSKADVNVERDTALTAAYTHLPYVDLHYLTAVHHTRTPRSRLCVSSLLLWCI